MKLLQRLCKDFWESIAEKGCPGRVDLVDFVGLVLAALGQSI
jgi:hypothetical protein